VHVAHDADAQQVLVQVQKLWRELGVTSITIQLQQDASHVASHKLHHMHDDSSEAEPPSPASTSFA
jgi:flagellar biogenesis protein FliO